jgi:hypothetical protein
MKALDANRCLHTLSDRAVGAGIGPQQPSVYTFWSIRPPIEITCPLRW